MTTAIAEDLTVRGKGPTTEIVQVTEAPREEDPSKRRRIAGSRPSRQEPDDSEESGETRGILHSRVLTGCSLCGRKLRKIGDDVHSMTR